MIDQMIDNGNMINYKRSSIENCLINRNENIILENPNIHSGIYD